MRVLAITTQLYRAAIILSPFVGIGLLQTLSGRSDGVAIQPAFVPLILLFGWLAFSTVGHPRGLGGWTADRLALALVLLWAAASLMLTWRLDDLGMVGEVAWLKSLKQFVTLLFFVACAVAPVVMVQRSERPREVLRALEVAASLALVIGGGIALLQLLADRFDPDLATLLRHWFSTNPSIAAGSEELYLGHSFTGIARARGSFPEPLHLGSFLVATLPVTAAMAWHQRSWSALWRWTAVVMGGIALVATYSRGAYLGFAFVVGGMLMAMARGRLPRPSRRRVLVALAAVAVGLPVLFSVASGVPPWGLPGLLVDRLLQSLAGHDMSNLTRVYAWEAAWSMFIRHPWAGVGWGAYGFHYFAVAGEGGAGAHFGWPMANSFPLLVLSELGAAGFVLAGRAGWPALRPGFARGANAAQSGDLAAMCTVLALATGGVLVHSLTFSQWNLPHIWILMGCSAAAASVNERVV